MLGKKPKPVIGILTGSLVPGHRSGIMGPTSTRTPADPKPQSPKGPKAFDPGAVGLGIVAALGKSSEIPANRALFSRNLSRSTPIPVKNNSRNSAETESGTLEEYTIVTCHGPNNSHTKVYCDGREGDDRTPFIIQNAVVKSNNKPSVFHISPPRFRETTAVPPSDFLSSCNMCNKKLHDKDIFMYRGEKAFCSTECRYRQIVMDERKEKRNSEAPNRAVEVASSPYANGGQIFTTGILAI